jgi:hypothetical protein
LDVTEIVERGDREIGEQHVCSAAGKSAWRRMHMRCDMTNRQFANSLSGDLANGRWINTCWRSLFQPHLPGATCHAADAARFAAKNLRTSEYSL